MGGGFAQPHFLSPRPQPGTSFGRFPSSNRPRASKNPIALRRPALPRAAGFFRFTAPAIQPAHKPNLPDLEFFQHLLEKPPPLLLKEFRRNSKGMASVGAHGRLFPSLSYSSGINTDIHWLMAVKWIAMGLN